MNLAGHEGCPAPSAQRRRGRPRGRIERCARASYSTRARTARRACSRRCGDDDPANVLLAGLERGPAPQALLCFSHRQRHAGRGRSPGQRSRARRPAVERWEGAKNEVDFVRRRRAPSCAGHPRVLRRDGLRRVGDRCLGSLPKRPVLLTETWRIGGGTRPRVSLRPSVVRDHQTAGGPLSLYGTILKRDRPAPPLRLCRRFSPRDRLPTAAQPVQLAPPEVLEPQRSLPWWAN